MTTSIVEGDEYAFPRLSPDGGRVVFLNLTDSDLWIRDFGNDRDTQLTETAGNDFFPAWRDDTTVTFATVQGDGVQLYWKTTVPGSEKQLIGVGAPGSWTRDGEILTYTVINDQGNRDIWWLPVGGDPVVFLNSSANERAPRLSPNGQWLAYISDKDGEDRIYVLAFPEGGEPYLVSDGPGTEPVWSRDGRELFYRTGNELWAVDVETGPEFGWEPPHILFEEPYEFGLGVGASYDVSDDGLFLMVRRNDDAAAGFTVVLNWFEELNRLVPVN